MLEVLQSVFSLIITLGILVTIHEYGHFWVARKCGVKVLRFSVGFGKPIWSWTDKTGTEFAVASIPLGGYVRMLDEREGEVPEEQKKFAFNNKPVSQRIAIASAGPIANFIFAIFAYWLMFLVGFSTLIPMIGDVKSDSEAARAGLASGMEIIAVDGTETPGWRGVNMALVNRIGESGWVTISATKDPNLAPAQYDLEINEWLVGREQTSLIQDLGIAPVRPPIPAVMGQIVPGSPAELAGIQTGDTVLEVSDQKVEDWYGLVERIKASKGTLLDVRLLRKVAGQELLIDVRLKPDAHTDDAGETTWRIGVGPEPFKYPEELIRTVRYGFLESVPHALNQTWADTVMTLKAIKKIVVGLLSLDNLSGPITIAQVASESISSGAEDFLRFLAFLSISLGVLNLLPIPVLDGGHILYYSIEAILRKPIPERWQVLGLKIGVSLILMLMVIALYNDLMRL